MDEPIKVAFVAPFYYPELKFGGPPKRLHGMARALQKQGHQVEVVTLNSARSARSDVVFFDGIRVQYMPWFGQGLYALPRRADLLSQAIGRADVVHCFGLYNFICPLAVRAASTQQKPVVLEPMGMYPPRVRSVAAKTIYNSTVTKWMARHASAIVATSDVEHEELKPLASFAAIVVRGNGIGVEDFASLPPSSMMRKRWGIGPEQQIVLYLGRISSKKNLRELVAAFSGLPSGESKLVIAGPVSEPAYAEQLKRDIAVSPRSADIVVEGPLYNGDLKAALSAADLFVMPSLNENFGNAAAEAVAAGVPVLLTETCGIAPMIHGRAGMAVPLGVEPLIEGLRLMLKPEVRDKMTARCEEVKRELCWDEPIAQQIALYHKVSKGKC